MDMKATQERAMASIRRITDIKVHTNADALELAIIDGWQCVVKKGDFQPNQVVVYFEIDSWIPHELAPFLSKGKEPREYEGVKGERLRTIKLRGELSQGLVLPMSVLPDVYAEKAEELGLVAEDYLGGNVTDILNVRKWEKPLNPQLQGVARGNFPAFLRKTDQERIQNIFRKLTPEQIADTYEVTLKVDGSSTTFYSNEGKTGVCSRNLDLVTDGSNDGNSFVQMFRKLGLADRLWEGYAVQGELYGAGINGNWEGLQDHQFKVFDIFDIRQQSYLDAVDRALICKGIDLEQVPILDYTTLEQFKTIDDFLDYADRPSINNPIAEGVVFKSLTNPNFSFKVINTKYLLNGGE